MQDNLKSIQRQIDRDHENAATARQQAEAERAKANMYDTEGRIGDKDFHQQQAQQFDDQAEQLENEASELEPKKAEMEARIAELKTQRETINRETLEKITAIDKELVSLQGSMTI